MIFVEYEFQQKNNFISDTILTKIEVESDSDSDSFIYTKSKVENIPLPLNPRFIVESDDIDDAWRYLRERVYKTLLHNLSQCGLLKDVKRLIMVGKGLTDYTKNIFPIEDDFYWSNDKIEYNNYITNEELKDFLIPIHDLKECYKLSWREELSNCEGCRNYSINIDDHKGQNGCFYS